VRSLLLSAVVAASGRMPPFSVPRARLGAVGAEGGGDAPSLVCLAWQWGTPRRVANW
jgi:hypothetical protein